MKQNIAVIGCGAWGQNHVRTAHGMGALRAVSDADAARAAQFGTQYSVPALSFDEALADSGIEGVILAVPAPLHAGMALRALAAGKHVLVEKPIAMTIAEAQTMVDAAKAAGRALMVGHILQYHPAFIALKGLVDNGTLGNLRHLYSNRLNFGRVRTEENVFWSFAPHDVSMILALAGRAPVSVQAWASAGLSQSAIASTMQAAFDFGGGLHGHVHVSWLNPFKEQKLVAVGDKAMAVFDDTQTPDKKLALYANSVTFDGGQPVLHKAEAEYIQFPAGEPLREEIAHFAQCMETGETPRTDGLEGLRVLKVMQDCDSAAARMAERAA